MQLQVLGEDVSPANEGGQGCSECSLLDEESEEEHLLNLSLLASN